MDDHYFSKSPTSKSEPQTWSFTLRNNKIQFTSDYGVFSKNEVDFGSRLLVETFEDPGIDGPFLDIGCGYGPIGIGIAKSMPDRKVYMVDVNARALGLAQKNAKDNRVDNVEIFESDIFDQIEPMEFAAIVTNPPIRAGKQVVHTILEKSYDFLKKNGSLWVVIQKKQGAPSAKKKLESIYDQVTIERKDKGYYILRADKF